MIVNEQVAIDHGLKKDEYTKICELLKRTPNITELGIFSAMWNEHCSYKSSRLHLKKLPTKGKQVIQGPGENAVKRNKIKRRLRNIVNEAVKKVTLKFSYSYLVIAKSTMLNNEYKNIKETLFQDLEKIK